MGELVGVVGVAAALFGATNVDDLVVLVAFFADRRFRTREVVAGQFGGIALLVTTSLLLTLATVAIPEEWVGLLGVLPILIGLHKLWGWWQDRGGAGDPSAIAAEATAARRRERSNLFAVVGVTVANGGDNLGVYVPVFGLMPPLNLLVVALTFAAMTGVWCVIGYLLVANPLVGRNIRAVGHRLLPFVLITVGGVVLLHADSLSLLRR